jgi:hypothetical protein
MNFSKPVFAAALAVASLTSFSVSEARAQSGLAAQLCDNPWKAICESQESFPQDRAAEVSRIKARIRAESLEEAAKPFEQGGCGSRPDPSIITMFRESGLSAYEARQEAILWATHDFGMVHKALCLGRKVEDKVFEVLATRGVSRGRVKAVFGGVRTELQRAIQEKMGSDPARAELVKEMIGVVGKIELILADRYAEYGRLNSVPKEDGSRAININAISNSDFGICGSDFLTRNMFSSSTGYTDPKTKKGVHTGMLAVVACPGQWLDLLTVPFGKPEQSLWQIFGHELAHQVHATRNRVADDVVLEDGTAMTFNAVPNYESYNACIRDTLAPPVLPPLSKAGREGDYFKWVSKELGHEASDAEFRLNEISADEWGNHVVRRLMDKNQLPLEERAFAVANSMRRLCRLPSGKPFITHSDTHPSGRFRIENMMRQPEMRAALQCAAPIMSGAEFPELQHCGF